MPAISKVRFTNIIYENGGKRYNDDLFQFDGHNGALLLENGGGKTVFIQTALQAVLPHTDMAERKIKNTLMLEGAPAHVAIEWILSDQPRRYAVTAVSLYMENSKLQSVKYAYDYAAGEAGGIEELPFALEGASGQMRPATRREISDYYIRMQKSHDNAKVFSTIQEYSGHIEERYKIVSSEWRKMAVINSSEGNVDEFFSSCRTTEQLLNNLLIPVVEEAIAGEEGTRFVETFERQREHFKKNKLLHEKINESISIKEALDGYVAVWEKYHNARQSSDKEKEKAKGLASYIDNRLEQVGQELSWHEKDMDVLKKDERQYVRMVDSHEILKLEKDLSAAGKALDQAETAVSRFKAASATYGKRKQNLEIHLLGKDIARLERRKELIESRLAGMDHSPEAEDIATLLKENSACIKGHFEYELELVSRELENLQKESERLQREKDLAKSKVVKASEKEKSMLAEMTRSATIRDLLSEEMEELKSLYVGEDSGLSALQAMSQNRLELSGLKKAALKAEEELDALEGNLMDCQVERESLAETHADLKEALRESRRYIKTCEETWNEAGVEFADMSVRQASLQGELDDNIALLTKHKENLERQASAYEKHDGEVLEGIIGKLDFTYEVTRTAVLETDSDNLVMLAEKLKEHEQVLPWPVSLNPILTMFGGNGDTKQVVDDILQRRKDLEEELYRIKARKELIDRLYRIYPVEQVAKQLETVRQSENLLGRHETRLKELNLTIENLVNEIATAKEKVDKTTGRIETLVQELAVSDSYLEKQAAYGQAAEAHAAAVRNHGEVERERQSAENMLDELEKNLEATAREIQGYQVEKKVLLMSSLYKEVAGYEAIGARVSLETLIEERERLQDAARGLHLDHEGLERQLADIRENLIALERERKRKVLEARYDIERIEVYYDSELDELYGKLKSLEKDMEKAESEAALIRDEKLKLETRVQILTSEVKRKYGDMYVFDMDPDLIPQKLQIEKGTLRDRNRRMEEEKVEIEEEIHSLTEKQTLLRIKNGASGFMADDIKLKPLEENMADAFEKNSDKVIAGLFSALDERARGVKAAYGDVMKEREGLAEFLSTASSDARLRESVIRNVRSKESLEELLEYQTVFGEVIDKTVKVAEDDKRESDIELQTFLRHLVSYVKNVADELAEIERKTEVTLDGETRRIFQIRLPEWDIEEGRILLRNYVNRLVEETEKSGSEDEETEDRMRQHLKDQLDVRNLLKVALGSQNIKIACRKVTNDLKITSAPASWESSNKWSGGEKWSKNMTLFLGLMNYMAEKKQHLSDQQKANRSVILDNPFGKASSEHVLAPVFAVAKTLGFQVIALTAHAEGQFISRYFPVVYSCRLRQSKDPSKRLMDHERTINYAYLKEHAPRTMMRMEEVEQIALFPAE